MPAPDVSASQPSLRAWAEAHAQTVPADCRGPAEAAAAPASEPAPTVLTELAERGTWAAGQTITSLAWGQVSDGSLVLAVGGDDGLVAICDPDTGEDRQEFTDGAGAVCALAWGRWPDGRTLLCAAYQDGAADVWDADTAELLDGIDAGNHGDAQVAWGHRPQGQPLLAAATAPDYTAWIWDPGTGQSPRVFAEQARDLSILAWGRMPDGSTVLAVGESDQNTVRVIDPGTGATLHTLTGRAVDTGQASTYWKAAWGSRPDGRPCLATAEEGNGSGGPLCLWTSEGGDFSATVIAPAIEPVFAMAWSPPVGGRVLLAVSTLSTLRIWDGRTGQLLHRQPLSFRYAGDDHLDWTLTADGHLLLAGGTANGRIFVWEAVLDPPAGVPGQPRPGPRAGWAGRQASRLLDPPEDVTPAFAGVVPAPTETGRMSCAMSADGRLVLAAACGPESSRDQRDRIHIWDLTAGAHLRTVPHGGTANCHALGNGSDGRLLLATGGFEGAARIWDPATGELLHDIETQDHVTAVAWGQRADGRPLLATRGQYGPVQIWDAGTGQRLPGLTADSRQTASVGWGHRPDGRPLLATGGTDGAARIWDPDTGELLHTLAGHMSEIWSLAWGCQPDGRPLLATGCYDGTVRIWDIGAEQTVAVASHHSTVYTVDWIQLPDRRQILASVSRDGTAQIWDPVSDARLAMTVTGTVKTRQVAVLGQDPAGDVLLVVANNDGGRGPARVLRVATTTDRWPAHGAGVHPRRAAALAGSLLRLGAAGLWLPAGLIADLVELTGQNNPAPGGGLAALTDDAGISRLRALGWQPGARVALGALLTSDLAIPERYTPPIGASPAQLRDSLTEALAQRVGDAVADAVPTAEIRAAAARVGDRTIALLQILGPAACATDPLLPVRLAHRVPQLPPLAPRELRLLAAAETRRPASGQEAPAGTPLHSPGTAGVARAGPLTRLLPTELALPHDLLTMRLAGTQLLYRQHRVPAPAEPQSVTVILDTTPPTYGPTGNTLRLAAHLITVALWDHGRYPNLINLARPGAVSELRSPADLVDIWAGGTLDDPAAALTAALRTAAEIGLPVVFATHFQTARDSAYTPGPVTRLLTARHPPERPPPPPASPWHIHLSPNPGRAELAAVTRLLLVAAGNNG